MRGGIRSGFFPYSLFVRGDEGSEKASIAVFFSGKIRILASLARGSADSSCSQCICGLLEAFKGHVYQTREECNARTQDLTHPGAVIFRFTRVNSTSRKLIKADKGNLCSQIFSWCRKPPMQISP